MGTERGLVVVVVVVAVGQLEEGREAASFSLYVAGVVDPAVRYRYTVSSDEVSHVFRYVHALETSRSDISSFQRSGRL